MTILNEKMSLLSGSEGLAVKGDDSGRCHRFLNLRYRESMATVALRIPKMAATMPTEARNTSGRDQSGTCWAASFVLVTILEVKLDLERLC